MTSVVNFENPGGNDAGRPGNCARAGAVGVDVRRLTMRRLFGWICLVCGVLIALWALAAIVQLDLLWARFGIPLTWEIISGTGPLFSRIATFFLAGVGLAVAGGWLVVRKRRPRLRNVPSQFE